MGDLELGRGVDLRGAVDEGGCRDRRGSGSSESYQTDERKHGEGNGGREEKEGGGEDGEGYAVGRKEGRRRTLVHLFKPKALQPTKPGVVGKGGSVGKELNRSRWSV